VLFRIVFVCFDVVLKNMIDHGAPKNLANHIGWMAIHEACFYNRIETVKILLLAGADSSIRTKSGSLPFHLAGLQVRVYLTSHLPSCTCCDRLHSQIFGELIVVSLLFFL
jgi:hypothetical protein